MSRIKIRDSIVKNKEIIAMLIQREIQTRYRGSWLGMGWSLINPLIMLFVYTFVFHTIFKSRWGNMGADSGDDPIFFALNLFIGLIIFNIFAETTSKSPWLIIHNPNYVKKVVFPIEALSIATAASAIFQAVTGVIMLVVINWLIRGEISGTLIVLPILWIGFISNVVSLSWVISTIGVFIKDTGQVVTSWITIMMFLTPVFYPTSSLPGKITWLAKINPMGYVIESSRLIIMNNGMPEISVMIMYLVTSLIICEISLRMVQRYRRYFGDYV